jgi:P-type conjugative transfer protein TrbJ
MRLLRYFTRRVLLLAGATALVQRLTKPKVARADLWGGDLPILGGILTQAFATVADLGTMIGSLAQQLDNMKTMLSELSPDSAEAVLNLISNGDFAFDKLTADIQSIGYTMQSVNAQFASVYETNYATLPIDKFDALYGRWHSEVLAASQVAARSQATLSTLKSNADEAARIVNASAASDGQVAQMQAIVQMLALMQNQNNSVLQSLTTTGRVLASDAAGHAALEQLAREKKRRAMVNYRYRGEAVPTVDKLP